MRNELILHPDTPINKSSMRNSSSFSGGIVNVKKIQKSKEMIGERKHRNPIAYSFVRIRNI